MAVVVEVEVEAAKMMTPKLKLKKIKMSASKIVRIHSSSPLLRCSLFFSKKKLNADHPCNRRHPDDGSRQLRV